MVKKMRCSFCGSGEPRSKYLLVDDELFWEWFQHSQLDLLSAVAFSRIQDGHSIDTDYILHMQMNIPVYLVLNISEIPAKDLEDNFQMFMPYHSDPKEQERMYYLKTNHPGDKYKIILLKDRYNIIKRDKEFLEEREREKQ